ncbi:hypothetical protein A3G55_04180 [Candidatus Giovannonibacteria bacterium RIFCSPLOWO2_12_FULL_44_25]|uniref:Uncharacterized protein n=3 Tax=Parcubacteria group TaxID=1794811 RepID=A0A837IGD7_9BACT|nr:MAG: hypothetical protein UW15_C0002G0003 [Parcubacteria group bacterium GW2011_GWC1_44_10]KKT59920.1 MAG: hypothetical protein UW53_C0005G0003 [Candidatus Giovannonibacteria bacterium GW2011_GWA1_44_25]KKU12009.1 MAG: hypothetical protein UX18_C0034G0003 [Candidatus Azambacteria bacterium GW2011_GWC2_45_7b]KKU29765.1 MAG: hypothetical protein UX43_C0006G0040 [Candidatus Giovannonibacteria bacterium GW2011_GWB1_46_20]OGF49131.1 MAG: hypothetical protein A2120_01560 [Candidatus Giovannonibact
MTKAGKAATIKYMKNPEERQRIVETKTIFEADYLVEILEDGSSRETLIPGAEHLKDLGPVAKEKEKVE